MSLFPCYEERKEDKEEQNQQILLGKSYQSAGELILSSENQNEKKKKKKKEKKKRKYRREFSDSDFDSENEYEGHKKLLLTDAVYLPNGNVIQAEQSNQLWRVDKGKDINFLQMGSFYRLDIPEYDITLLPQSIFGHVTKRTSLPQRAKTIIDSHRYSLRSRYYNDPTAQNPDLRVYCPRSLLDRPDKRIKLTSFLIPVPPPLPRDDQVISDDTLGSTMKSNVEVLIHPYLFSERFFRFLGSKLLPYSQLSINWSAPTLKSTPHIRSHRSLKSGDFIFIFDFV
jgi:hypothetical protein